MTQTLELTSQHIIERVNNIALEKLKNKYPYLHVQSKIYSYECGHKRGRASMFISDVCQLYELEFDYIPEDQGLYINLHNKFEDNVVEKHLHNGGIDSITSDELYLEDYPTIEIFDKKVKQIVDSMCDEIGKDSPMANEMLTILQKIHKLFDNLNLPPGLKCENYNKQLDIINLHLESKEDSEHYKQTAENYGERAELLRDMSSKV